jgi:putative ABC transport system permease protein
MDIIRNFGQWLINKIPSMFKNYLIVAWRNLVRQKGLSFISIFGLALGIACFSLLVLYAMNEFGFDGFHQRAAQIFRVYDGDQVWTPKQDGSIYTPMPLGPAMKQDLADVEDYMRYVQSIEAYLKVGNGTDRENIAYADPSFFSMFSYRLRYGNARTALADINNIVLTEETAKRLFGTADAVGKNLQIKVYDAGGFQTFMVSAVLENMPANSYFSSFGMLAHISALEAGPEIRGDIGNWHRSAFQTFVQLRPGSKLPSDRRQLSAFKEKYVPGKVVDGKKMGNWIYGLEPLTHIHTDVAMGGFMNNMLKIPPVDASAIWIIVAIATGVLLIACINFTTLAVGRSANRAREVGVRKVIGGSKGSIRRQFLVEAYVLTFIAAVLGFLMASWLLPFFNALSGRTLRFSFSQYPLLPWVGVALLVGVGLLAGGYPAVMLSRFRAVEALKSRVKVGGANFFTKVLVTTQFVLSIGLIIATVVIMQQLYYMQSKNPGFDKENTVVVKTQYVPETRKLLEAFRQELAEVPPIAGVAAADKGIGYREGQDREGVDLPGGSFIVFKFGVDANYIPVMGMHLLAGRNFDPAIAADTLRSVVINETMMKKLGWTPAAAIGQRLKGMHSGDTASPPVVIGVVKDINFLSMSGPVEPQLFHQYGLGEPRRFFVRLRPGDPSAALAAIATAWRGVAPDYQLRDNFLDEDLDRFYTAEIRLSHIVGWAGGVSIFLACLGLFGLAALATINRTKEIGIRKLLGASLGTFVSLISRDFVRLVLVAFLIAAPLAWYFMSNWLQGFYFRIQLEWWVFGLAGVSIAGIAWVTVAGLAARAGMANPVESLRSE